MQQVAHHYITQSYQKNFADKSGKIWVLNDKDKIYNTNPVNTFKEKHFYTVKIPQIGGSLVVEKTLAQMEGDFARVITEKIDKKLPLSIEDRISVSLFVSSLLIRTKSHRDNLKSSLEEMVEDLEQTANDPEQLKSLSASVSDGKGVSLKELKEGLRDFDSWHSLSVANNMFELAPIILQMKWSFFIAPTDNVFISSDDPVGMVSPERELKYGTNSFGARSGLKHADTQLTLPLSSEITLYADWSTPEQGYIEATNKQYEQLNYRVTRSSMSLFANNEQILLEILTKYNEHQNGIPKSH